MKTLELTTVAHPVEELFELATTDGLMLRLPDGKVFLLTLMDADDDGEDFADEVARTRQNAALMDLLRERSNETVRYTSQQVRERLGLTNS